MIVLISLLLAGHATRAFLASDGMDSHAGKSFQSLVVKISLASMWDLWWWSLTCEVHQREQRKKGSKVATRAVPNWLPSAHPNHVFWNIWGMVPHCGKIGHYDSTQNSNDESHPQILRLASWLHKHFRWIESTYQALDWFTVGSLKCWKKAVWCLPLKQASKSTIYFLGKWPRSWGLWLCAPFSSLPRPKRSFISRLWKKVFRRIPRSCCGWHRKFYENKWVWLKS